MYPILWETIYKHFVWPSQKPYEVSITQFNSIWNWGPISDLPKNAQEWSDAFLFLKIPKDNSDQQPRLRINDKKLTQDPLVS